MPWLALAVVLADVWVQRATGVMHRAVTVEREKVEREKQEAEDSTPGWCACFDAAPHAPDAAEEAVSPTTSLLLRE
jgi:hypothetical protein